MRHCELLLRSPIELRVAPEPVRRLKVADLTCSRCVRIGNSSSRGTCADTLTSTLIHPNYSVRQALVFRGISEMIRLNVKIRLGSKPSRRLMVVLVYQARRVKLSLTLWTGGVHPSAYVLKRD